MSRTILGMSRAILEKWVPLLKRKRWPGGFCFRKGDADLHGLSQVKVIYKRMGQGSRFTVRGSKFKVQSSKFKVQGSGFKVRGSRMEKIGVSACSKDSQQPIHIYWNCVFYSSSWRDSGKAGRQWIPITIGTWSGSFLCDDGRDGHGPDSVGLCEKGPSQGF